MMCLNLKWGNIQIRERRRVEIKKTTVVAEHIFKKCSIA
jgi:hypothetical protein